MLAHRLPARVNVLSTVRGVTVFDPEQLFVVGGERLVFADLRKAVHQQRTLDLLADFFLEAILDQLPRRAANAEARHRRGLHQLAVSGHHQVDEKLSIETMFTGMAQLVGVLLSIDGGLCDDG